jgi:hypothetical protein
VHLSGFDVVVVEGSASNTGIALGASVLDRVNGRFPDAAARQALTAAMVGHVSSASLFDQVEADADLDHAPGTPPRSDRRQRARHARSMSLGRPCRPHLCHRGRRESGCVIAKD